MKRILVVGSNNMDLVIQTPRLPVLGETLTGSGFRTVPGGKGANQALAAARLGGEVKMLGCVGEDLFGAALKKSLAAGGVDDSAVERTGSASGIAVITVCGGDNHIILDPGANALVSPRRIEANRALFEWAELVLLQFEIPMPSVTAAARLARACGAKVLLNPAPMADFDPALLDCADIFAPNRSEAARMLGFSIETPADAARAVRELNGRGIGQVLVTLGGDGCAYNRDGKVFRHGIYPARAVDTTAAGDAFVAALATRLDAGGFSEAALSFATAASAITVSRPGASCSLPSLDEVERFLGVHAKDTHIEEIAAS